MNPLAIYLGGNNIGQLLMLFVGIVISCAIVYAIMVYCGAPPLLYKIAAVVGLVILLVIVIAFFFGGDTGGSISVHR